MQRATRSPTKEQSLTLGQVWRLTILVNKHRRNATPHVQGDVGIFLDMGDFGAEVRGSSTPP
jgi:hypothetical protein